VGLTLGTQAREAHLIQAEVVPAIDALVIEDDDIDPINGRTAVWVIPCHPMTYQASMNISDRFRVNKVQWESIFLWVALINSHVNPIKL
jgi:predicted neuraminidase